jgi:hypothetical protein
MKAIFFIIQKISGIQKHCSEADLVYFIPLPMISMASHSLMSEIKFYLTAIQLQDIL